MAFSRCMVALSVLGSAVGCSASAAVEGGFDAGLDHVATIAAADATVVAETGTSAPEAGLETELRLALLTPLDFGVDICVNGVGPLVNLPSDLHDAGPEASSRDATRDVAPDVAHDAPHDAMHDVIHDAARDALHDALADARDAPLEARGDGPHDATLDVPRDATTDAIHDATVDAVHDAPIDATDDGRHGEDVGPGRDAARDTGMDAVTDGARPKDAARDSARSEQVGGVLYRHVSAYLPVAMAGTLDVTIVKGGSVTCAGAAALGTQTVTLDPGKFSTLIVLGGGATVGSDGGPNDAADRKDAAEAGQMSGSDASGRPVAPALSIVVLTDEPATLTSAAKARFFNATRGTAAGSAVAVRVTAVGTSMSGTPLKVPLARDVAVDQVSQQNHESPAVDPLGYWTGQVPSSTSPVGILVSAIEDAGVSPRRDGATPPPTSWTFSAGTTLATALDLVAGTNHTGYLIGPATSPTLVWCDDRFQTVSAPPCVALLPE